MPNPMRVKWAAALGFVVAVCAANTGCLSCHPDPKVCASELPREKNLVTMPTYVVEPPDILLIDAIRVVPKPPYKIEPLDQLLINATNTLPTEPIAGLYVVDPDGTVNLGLSYGSARVVGLTIPQAREEILKTLKIKLQAPEVTVALGLSRGQQQIRGDHLVRPDGTVSLGLYGSVRITGLTLPEAKAAIEAHLSQFLERPEVSVDVLAYNSKVFYVIYEGGIGGEQVVRLPVTGNDTVLDAVANLAGLLPASDEHHIWIARPTPACTGCDQILAVSWADIVRRGRTETNYQLLPGDRLYVKADALVLADTRLNRLLAPFERLFGFVLLGNGTVRALQTNQNNNNNRSGF